MSIEAMKLALEALEYDTKPETEYGINTAITVLRAAIEQAEKQEPVAWAEPNGFCSPYRLEGYDQPLYTAPPQREWVGLTPEEVKEITLANRPYVVDMVAALEAKLKEKNNGNDT